MATRASAVFERLVIAVYESPPKQILFSSEERVALVEKAVGHLENVEVVAFSGWSRLISCGTSGRSSSFAG